jgi:hypothetical protein
MVAVAVALVELLVAIPLALAVTMAVAVVQGITILNLENPYIYKAAMEARALSELFGLAARESAEHSHQQTRVIYDG